LWLWLLVGVVVGWVCVLVFFVGGGGGGGGGGDPHLHKFHCSRGLEYKYNSVDPAYQTRDYNVLNQGEEGN